MSTDDDAKKGVSGTTRWCELYCKSGFPVTVKAQWPGHLKVLDLGVAITNSTCTAIVSRRRKVDCVTRLKEK